VAGTSPNLALGTGTDQGNRWRSRMEAAMTIASRVTRHGPGVSGTGLWDARNAARMGVVDTEERLPGGNLSSRVMRVGATVRRPVGPWTPAVHALLNHLHAVGFDGAPRVLGLDDAGREILEYIPGEVAWDERHHQLLGADQAVQQAGALLRRFHDAVADF